MSNANIKIEVPILKASSALNSTKANSQRQMFTNADMSVNDAKADSEQFAGSLYNFEPAEMSKSTVGLSTKTSAYNNAFPPSKTTNAKKPPIPIKVLNRPGNKENKIAPTVTMTKLDVVGSTIEKHYRPSTNMLKKATLVLRKDQVKVVNNYGAADAED